MSDYQRSTCPFCALGCTMRLRGPSAAPYFGDAQKAALDHDTDGRVNRGSLCARGNMALELLTTPARLEHPLLRGEDGSHDVAWSAALDEVCTRVEQVRDEHGPEALGILAGPYLSCEETALAVRLAERIGTSNLDLCQAEDRVVFAGLAGCGSAPPRVTEVAQLEAMRATLLVGDVFTHAPCIARPVLHARYDRRNNWLGVLGFWRSRTFIFGKPALRCLPGRESVATAQALSMALQHDDARDVAWAGRAREALSAIGPERLAELSGLRDAELRPMVDALFAEADSGVIFGCGFAETERADLVAGLSAQLAEITGSRFLAVYRGANSVGVRSVLDEAGLPGADGLTAPEMLEAAGTGDVRALIVLGADALGGSPGVVADEAAAQLELLVSTAPLDCATVAASHIVLPTALWGEKTGTAMNALGHVEALSAALPPPGVARRDRDVLAHLCQHIAAHGTAGGRSSDAPCAREDFFGELELHVRLEQREESAHDVGPCVLYPEFASAHASDGWLTRSLSWPRHEMPSPCVAMSPAHATALGVSAGDTVRVRARDAAAQLAVRIERRLEDDVVLVPPHFPEVRQLTPWRVDPVLRDLDLRPARVSVERCEEVPR